MLGALWLIFTGKTAAAELAMGAGAAGVALFAMTVLEFRKLAHVAPMPHAFALAWRLPWEILRGTWQLLVVLARQLAGRERAGSMLVASPFTPVGDDDREATKRALAAGYTSITPSDVVVGIDRKRHFMLIHRVAESPTSKMTLALGAEA